MFERFKYGWNRSGPFKRDIDEIIREIRGDGYKISPELIPRPREIYKQVRQLYHGAVKTWIPLATYNSIPIPEELLKRHILIIGTTGSGKTTLIKHLIRGLVTTAGPNDKFVVFDPKGDYLDIFRETDIETYVLSEDPSLANVTWNIFRDALYNMYSDIHRVERELHRNGSPYKKIDEAVERFRRGELTPSELMMHVREAFTEINEHGRILIHEYKPFVEAIHHNLKLLISKIVDAKAAVKMVEGFTDQQYFARDAPLSLLSNTATALVLSAVETGCLEILNNRMLYEVAASGLDELLSLFRAYNLKEGLYHIDSGYTGQSTPQTQGVISTFRQFIDEFFLGNFREAGEFSLREAIRSRGAKAILFEYRPGNEELVAPIYSALIGMLIDEVLNRTVSRFEGMVYFILDEFHALPKIHKVETFINMSRSLGGAVIAGTQSYAQLKHAYGEKKAEALVSAFNTRVFLRILDEESANLLIHSIGEISVYKKRETNPKKSYGLGDVIMGTAEKGSYSLDISLVNIPKKVVNRLRPGLGFINISGVQPFIAPIAKDFHMKDVEREVRRDAVYRR